MNKKRLASFLMTFALTVVALFAFSMSSFASDGITERLDALRSSYPQGYYWNHKMSTSSDESNRIAGNKNEKFSRNVTLKPCTTHKSTGKAGYYDCNYFDGGTQCFGFARRVFYDVFGVRASACKKRYDYNNIKVGDCLRLFNDTHSAVVLAREGNTLKVVECNLELSGSQYNCIIEWNGCCKVSDVTYFHRATNYEKIKNSTTNKKPGKTSSIKAVTTTNSVKLTWNKVSGATGYRVYQYDYNKGKSDRLATITGTTYTIKNLKAHTRYRFSVKAYRKVGSTYYWSDSYTIINTATKPGQVTGLKATPSTTSVKLTWNKVSGATGYHIFTYNTSTKKYTSIGKTTANSATVKKLTKGKTYNLAVQAYSTIEGKDYWGKVSSILKVTTKKSASTATTVSNPDKVVVTTVIPESTKVTIFWNEVKGATGYEIYSYNTSSGTYSSMGTVTSAGCTISPLTPNSTYYYAVQAYKAVGGEKYTGEFSSNIKVVTSLTASAWYKGYQKVLDAAFPYADYDGYFLGDITGDCSPELFVLRGGTGAVSQWYAEIYTLKNSVATYVGQIARGHYLFAPTESGVGFLRMVARQGDDTVFYQTTDRLDNSFTLYSGTSVFDGTPDFKEELVYFDAYYGRDYEGLKWTSNPHNNNLYTLNNSSYGTYYG